MILHVSYGLGFLIGLLKFWNRWGDKKGKVGVGLGKAPDVVSAIRKAMARAKRLSLATLAAIIAGAFLSKDAKGAATLTAGAMAMAPRTIWRPPANI